MRVAGIFEAQPCAAHVDERAGSARKVIVSRVSMMVLIVFVQTCSTK